MSPNPSPVTPARPPDPAASSAEGAAEAPGTVSGSAPDIPETGGGEATRRPRTDTMRTAVLASLAGRAWPMVLGFLAVPVYLHHVGVEAYALVGAFALLQSICTVLDLGLGATITRELARLDGRQGGETVSRARDLVRTFAAPYWGVALLLALVSLVFAGPVAARWFNPETVTNATLRTAALLMGLATAAQLPFALYTGVLLGLQRQVRLNALIVVFATLRVAVTIGVLTFVSPTIEAFFACQVAVSLVQTIAGAVAVHGALPGSGRGRFRSELLRGSSRFAGGVAGITLLGLALTHADKLVLSNALPLTEFGYYTLAASLAVALLAVAQPVYAAVYPRLAALAAGGDREAESTEFHRAAQVLAVLVLPAGVVLAWFAGDALLAWTLKPDVAANAALPASLLAAGCALNGLMHVPFALMLAHGWTRLPLLTNLIALALLLPLLVLSASVLGTAGAALVWLLLNAGYVAVQAPMLHTRLLRGEYVSWVVRDVALPLVGAVAGTALAAWLLPETTGRWPTLARLAACGTVAVVGATLLAPHVLGPLLARLRR